MLPETSLLYKLTILYLLSKVNYPISNNTLTNFLLENDFTDYFNLQQIMGELIDDEFVIKDTYRSKTLYRLSPSGQASIKLLERELAPAMRADIDKYIKDNGIALREDISVMSNYYQADINDYLVNMYIEEDGKKLLDINMSVPTKADAERVCSKWTSSNEKIYSVIIQELLR